ncbi:thioredoxin-like domain-containing protein [Phormidesmis priestleyi]
MARVRAPQLPQESVWLNTDHPFSLKNLKGRIVLLDFWTYCCINCLHVLPDLKYLEQKYQNCLTTIAVHSAKFDHEKETENIRQAILRYDIEHPVLIDSDFRVWQHYAIRAYPTFVVIDPQGYVVATVSGEGKRDFLDELIGKLIEEAKGTISSSYPQGVASSYPQGVAPPELTFILEKQQNPLITPLAFPGKVLADEESDFFESPTRGRLFIADTGHHRIVVSTLKGEVLQVIGTGKPGLTDGQFSAAQFSAPQGMAIDATHQILYVADTGNHALRRVDLKRGMVETIAGTGQQSHTLHPHGGKALEIALNSPWDLVFIKNQLFIAMAGSHQIWQLQLETGLLTTYAGSGAEGWADGTTYAAFAQPSGIATNGKSLFVADSEISSIRSISLDIPEVKTVCGSGDLYGFGDVDGIGEAVRLQHCIGITFAEGGLWIADTYNHKIKRVNPTSGFCQTILGDGNPGNQDGKNAQFFEPSGLTATQTYLYIADTNNHAIRRVDLQTLDVTTIAFPNLCAPDVCFPNQ